MARVAVGLFWVFWGLRLYQPTFYVPGAAALGLIFTLGGVGVLVVACLPLAPRWVRLFDLVLLLGTFAAFAFWTRSAVYGSPAYGTDEVAFDQGAAQLLLHGQNPYGVDLSWTLDAFQVLPSGTTNLLNGGFVHTLSYPAAAFLVYVPLLLAGVHGQAAIYVDSMFWILGIAVLWFVLPFRLRPIAPILGSLGVFIDYAAGGVTDSLMLPFLVLALWRWDRFGDPEEPSAARWVGPLALGLACDFKQSAWFLVPFLILAVALEGRVAGWGLKPVRRYVALLGIAFALPNLPFIVWNLPAWLAGVSLPLTTPLVPFGQGLVALTTYFSIGGGNLGAFTLSGVAMLAALGLALVVWYPHLKRLVPALPLIALLLPTRSLNSYFVYAVPGLIVAVATVRPVSARWMEWNRPLRRIVALGSGLGLVGSLGFLSVALMAAQPLVLTPVSEHTTGQLQSVDEITVNIRNRANVPLKPHFAVALGAYMSSIWTVHEGPTVLSPGQSAQYVLWAPNAPSMPGINQESVLYAMTGRPGSISSAPLFPAIAQGTRISPQAINEPVASPPRVVFTVQLIDRLNNAVAKAGVPVSLGQVLYTSEGLYPGETSINGHPEGQSPITAKTDAQGIATFAVRAIQQQPHEVFFQAWLPDPYPHGYSSLVSVHFQLQR